jgi:hypothetical protein
VTRDPALLRLCPIAMDRHVRDEEYWSRPVKWPGTKGAIMTKHETRAREIADKSIELRVCCEKYPPCQTEEWRAYLAKEIASALREETERCAKITEAEPEFLGDPGVHGFSEQQAYLLRLATRLTKECIAKNIRSEMPWRRRQK